MTEVTEVSFEVPEGALDVIGQIVDRAKSLGCKHPFDRTSAVMDLCATHANGCPMNFEKLRAADDFNLLHDVAGIYRHMDRGTGKLTNFFRPRCALPARSPEAADARQTEQVPA